MLKLQTCAGALFIFVLAMSGCEQQGRGFSLPAGDVEKGRLAFEELACTTCHSISGADPAQETSERQLHVILGGKTSRIKTYGDLVTSVINPSHKIANASAGKAQDAEGRSNMRNYNKTMKVQQLVDLVTYLQTTYTVVVPQTHYRVYL